MQGHYGEVFRGSYTDEHGNVSPVAIKCLKSKMYQKFAKEFEDEFQIMIELDQPNIVKIIGQCAQADSGSTKLENFFIFIWQTEIGSSPRAFMNSQRGSFQVTSPPPNKDCTAMLHLIQRSIFTHLSNVLRGIQHESSHSKNGTGKWLCDQGRWMDVFIVHKFNCITIWHHELFNIMNRTCNSIQNIPFNLFDTMNPTCNSIQNIPFKLNIIINKIIYSDSAIFLLQNGRCCWLWNL